LKLRPQVQFFPQRCIVCGECVTVCQHEAHALVEPAETPPLVSTVVASDRRSTNAISPVEPAETIVHTYDRTRCVRCGKCVESCCAEALQMTAREISLEAVVAEVRRDRAFYETSGGGLTLSGGEPLLQRAFSRAILEACQREGIHTALETSAFCEWDELAELLPAADLVMMDIKHLDEAKHIAATGVSNRRILANAQRLAARGVPLILRIPVIPGVNDTAEEISAMANFVASLQNHRQDGVSRYQLELLPFHRLAADKYASLSLDYPARDLLTPTHEQMAQLLAAAQQHVPHAVSR
jgi:pyruvate formate lyase activating enzyme